MQIWVWWCGGLVLYVIFARPICEQSADAASNDMLILTERRRLGSRDLFVFEATEFFRFLFTCCNDDADP